MKSAVVHIKTGLGSSRPALEHAPEKEIQSKYQEADSITAQADEYCEEENTEGVHAGNGAHMTRRCVTANIASTERRGGGPATLSRDGIHYLPNSWISRFMKSGLLGSKRLRH